jgi:hypothetical protein
MPVAAVGRAQEAARRSVVAPPYGSQTVTTREPGQESNLRNRLPQIAGIMAGAAFPGRGATRCSSVAGQVGVGAKPASRASSAAWSGPTKGG